MDASITEVVNNVFHLEFPTRYQLLSTFLRFQEHYESPKFRNKIFSLEEYMDWYAKEHENFTYFQDWSGCNVPSYVLKPFYEGKFDPLSKKEQDLLNTFADKEGKFYLIGTFKQNRPGLLMHEICHGLFYTNPSYKKEVLAVLKDVNARGVERFLEKKGYHRSVWRDETHAYLTEDIQYLRSKGVKIDGLKDAHKALRKIYESYTQ